MTPEQAAKEWTGGESATEWMQRAQAALAQDAFKAGAAWKQGECLNAVEELGNDHEVTTQGARYALNRAAAVIRASEAGLSTSAPAVNNDECTAQGCVHEDCPKYKPPAPAPSEDDVARAAVLEEEREKVEGEKWGRRLYELRIGGIIPGQWETLPPDRRTYWTDEALRFRAKCAKENEILMKALEQLRKAHDKCLAAPPGVQTIVCAERGVALSGVLNAFAALPAPDEPPKPRPSDEELGWFAWAKSSEWTVSPSRRTSAELGAAIRAKLEGK